MSLSLDGNMALGTGSITWPSSNLRSVPVLSSAHRLVPGHSKAESAFGLLSYRAGSRWTLVLQGELDIATVADFEQHLTDAELTRPNEVVLDLRDLDFLDCSGLHSFVSAEKRLRSAGGKLLLVPGSTQIQRLFEVTYVDSFFEYVEPHGIWS